MSYKNNKLLNIQFRKWVFVLTTGVLFLVFLNTGSFIIYPEDNIVNSKTCAECHEDISESFLNNPHKVIDEKGLHNGFSCKSCHGNLAKHLDNAEQGNIFAFSSSDKTIEKSGKCLDCHRKEAGRFLSSNHSNASLDCTECHKIHSKFPKMSLLKKSSLGTCFSCHEDVFAGFRLNKRHRLKEGIIGCTDCHNPHEPATRERLGGFKDLVCFKCHKEKEGPFLHEHGAVQVEGCSSCHEVHGSQNRHMLKNQKVADLCYSCHTYRPGWHATLPNVHNQNCSTCHSTIHGSNLSSKFIK